MACLNNRVQKIMYTRLQSYRFIDDGHLPYHVPAGVVLNSGGSYLQLTTWEYLKSARFVTDPSVEAPIIQVTDAPGYTHCNAVYVATTTRHHGSVVYVSVSPLEVYGPKKGKEDPRAWDGKPMKHALPSDVIRLPSRWGLCWVSNLGNRSNSCVYRLVTFKEFPNSRERPSTCRGSFETNLQCFR